MYSDENPTDPTQFTGNLEASIEVLQNYYPQIRIIVMSPTYAYAVDENGDYVAPICIFTTAVMSYPLM